MSKSIESLKFLTAGIALVITLINLFQIISQQKVIKKQETQIQKIRDTVTMFNTQINELNNQLIDFQDHSHHNSGIDRSPNYGGNQAGRDINTK